MILLKFSMQKINRLGFIIAISFALIVPAAAFIAAPTSFAASCSATGNTGLNASIIAVSNHVYTGTVSAAGCDIGIYIGSGVSGVVITNATITGANDHGIFAQDATNVTVSHSTITGNGLNPHTCKGNETSNCINEDKAVQFAGVNSSIIADNNVSYNRADGGIGISDDGAVDSGAVSAGSSSSHFTSSNDVIANNTIAWNANGCGVVVAGYNNGTATINIVVKNNSVFGNSFPKNPPHGPPAIGQIVLAADAPGSTLTGTVITNNTIDGSIPPGIVIHSNAPGDVIVNTTISANVLINNGDEAPPSPFFTINSPVLPTGIAIIGESYTNSSGQVTPIPGGAKINNIVITNNTAYSDVNAVWVCNAGNVSISSVLGNSTNQVNLCSTQPKSEVVSIGITLIGGLTSSSTSSSSTTSSSSSSSTSTSTTQSSSSIIATSAATTSSSASSSSAISTTDIAAIIVVLIVIIGAVAYTRMRKK